MQELAQRPLATFTAWLARSAVSELLQTVDWLVPAIQTLHILCVALVISANALLALAVFGRYGREQPLRRAFARFTPAVLTGVPLLLVSGALMITAEPDRALPNPVFQLKMLLLLAAAALTWLCARRVRRAGPAATTADPQLRALAGLSLVLWISVLVAGRWIAYSLSR